MDFIRTHRLAILFWLNFLAALALLAALYVVGLDPAVIGRLHARYWNYAIPAAVSELDYGLGGYRAYVAVLMHFIDNATQQATLETANQLIASAQALQNVAASGIYLFPGDEKGLQDFVALAFRLFGTKIQSLSVLYTIIVAAAVLLHAVYFARQPALLAVQLVALAAILATVPALRITSELGSLLNPRAFGLLALPATISLTCAAMVGQITLWRWPLLALQVAIVAFVVHVRNAEVWQLAAPCILAVGLAVWRGRPSAGHPGVTRNSQAWTSAGVVAAVCGVFFLSQFAAQSRLDPEYFSSKLVHKIFWHNVGIGFSVSPRFREKYNLELTDTSFLMFVARSPEVAAEGEAGRRVFWRGTYTGQWVGGDPEIPDTAAMYHAGMVRDFVGYERFAKQVVMRLARDHPWWTVKLVVYDKPKLMIRQVINAARVGKYTPSALMLDDQVSALLGDRERIEKRAYLRPLSIFSLLSVGLLAAGLLAARQTNRGALAAAAGIVLVLSTAPLSATYPLIHLMASFFAAILFAVLIFVGLFCARIVELFWPPPEKKL